MVEIGQRLYEIRSSLGLTQTAFAQRIGISQSALGNYERGTRLPDAGVILAIASRFDLSTDFILGVENPFASNDAVKLSERVYKDAIKSLVTTLRTMADGLEMVLSEVETGVVLK